MNLLCGLELKVQIGGEEVEFKGLQENCFGDPFLYRFLLEKALEISKKRLLSCACVETRLNVRLISNEDPKYGPAVWEKIEITNKFCPNCGKDLSR